MIEPSPFAAMRHACVALAVVCMACQGMRGAAGKRGADGEDGERGQQGEMGEQGTTGARGPAGPPGSPGRDGTSDGVESAAAAAADTPAANGGGYRPTAFVGCGALLDLVSGEGLGEDGTADTLVEYELTVFSNADLEVRCDASLGSDQSAMFSAYYPSITNGASSGTCEVGLDYLQSPEDDGSAGFWRMQIEADGVLTASYFDPDPEHPLDGSIYSFAEADCSAYAMSPEGSWQPTKVADVF